MSFSILTAQAYAPLMAPPPAQPARVNPRYAVPETQKGDASQRSIGADLDTGGRTGLGTGTTTGQSGQAPVQSFGSALMAPGTAYALYQMQGRFAAPETPVLPQPKGAELPGQKAAADTAEDEGVAEDDGGLGDDLSAEEQAQVQDLRTRDREVRTHERAHQAAGGGLTGGATFETVKGPDGHSYAVAGEVSISVRTGATPDETIALMNQVQRAAMAPADPSGQDRSVAARAESVKQSARAEKAEQRAEAMREALGGGAETDSPAPPAGRRTGVSDSPLGRAGSGLLKAAKAAYDRTLQISGDYAFARVAETVDVVA